MKKTLPKTLTTYTKYFLKAAGLFLALVCGSDVFAQYTDNFYPVYEKNGFKVEVKFSGDSTACEAGNTPMTYRYKVTGKYTGPNPYLNWSVIIRDCDGQIKRRNIAEEVAKFPKTGGIYFSPGSMAFTARYIIKPPTPSESDMNENPVRKVEIIKNLTSSPPLGVVGPNTVRKGESVTLKVRGGELGIGASWVWYRDDCGLGQSIGTGETLQIGYLEAGRIYVRAEGVNNTTSCAQTTVNYDKTAAPPQSINGNNAACAGQTLRYTVGGGSTGDGGNWAWYLNSCEGQLLKRGPENYLEYTINDDAVLFVRAENPLGNTGCISLPVKVSKVGPAPTSLKAPVTSCEGEPITIEIVGNLMPGNQWELTENSCNGSSIGSSSGNTFTVKPSLGSHTYFVKSKTDCGSGTCTQVSVRIIARSQNPTGIDVKDYRVYKNKTAELTVRGGTLSEGAQYVWYEGSSEYNKSEVARSSSPSLKRKFSSSTTVYVGIEDAGCKATTSKLANTYISPSKMHNWRRSYNNYYKDPAFFHVGFDVGFAYNHYKEYARGYYSSGAAAPATNVGKGALGMRAGLTIHPIYYKLFSVGGGAAFTFKLLDGSTTDSLSYNNAIMHGEVALGANKVKILARGEASIDNYSLSRTVEDSRGNEYRVSVRDKKVYTLKYGLGLRFGGYRRNGSAASSAFDVVYQIQSTAASEFPTAIDLDQLTTGLYLNWWYHSRQRIYLDLIGTQKQQDIVPQRVIPARPMIRFGWVVPFDYFY